MKYVNFLKNNVMGLLDEKTVLQTRDKVFDIEKEFLDSSKNDWTGWYELPIDNPFQEANEQIIEIANEIKSDGSYLIVIGIGGSYLGAKAVIEALQQPFEPSKVIFAGFDLEPLYLKKLLDFLKDKDFYVNVISKSGTTIEPAVTFRFLKQLLEKKYSTDECKKRIIVTTDKSKGLLRDLVCQKGYRDFIVPDNIGGRFSVLTPVGLLPVAAGGFDIKEMIQGAKSAHENGLEKDLEKNIIHQYAIIRYLLYKQGKSIEILSCFHPPLRYFNEWWKQLFGESEGKEAKGLFPASAVFTTDLHSLGQWIQEGPENKFETFMFVENENIIQFPEDAENVDQLNYLTGKDINEINKKAYLGTQQAHTDGGIPNVSFEISKLNEFTLGEMIFLFEKTTALVGYLMEVNPFNQPGVEAYKKNMFKLLGRPGY